MNKRILVLFLGLFIFILASCSKDDNPAKPTEVDEFGLVAGLGDTYFSAYKTAGGKSVNISIADVFTNLTDGNTTNDPYIIDFRSAADFATGHIKGAVNIALDQLITKVEDGTIPKTKTILDVCYTGQNASYATAVLNLLGYEAQNLSWGMCGVTTADSITGTKNWVNQIAADEFATQLTPTETALSTQNTFPTLSTGKETAEDIIKERYKAVMSAGGMGKISAADLFANPGNNFIVNYWPTAEYTSPGHIPGAYCFEPNTSLLKDAKLKYLPTDKTIIFYCYSGQTSAQVTAYLQLLGYNAKSLLYGVNGFAYNSLSKSKYVAPVNDYSSIVTK
jgi:rhodanese-related sulfurtransferase